ncbi:MAG: DUF4249 domain-containing protein [Bacteroidota bacterium]
MKHSLKTILVALSFLLVSGCEKDFMVPEAEGASKLVVNCRLDNQRIIKVYLSESTSPYESAKLKPITDAVVELYSNDSLLGILPFAFTDSAHTFGCYLQNEFARLGNKYSVQITHPRYGVVVAQDIVPALPAVTSHRLIQYGDSTNQYLGQHRFQFQDDASQENFYRINIWQWGKGYVTDTQGQRVLMDYGYFSRPEVTSQLSDTARDYGAFLLFSDKGFNGQMKEINMHFLTIDLQNVEEGNLVVEFTSVSRAHYLYYKTLEQYHNSPSGYQAAQVFGNISNGYGIFMGEAIYSMHHRVK